MAKNKNKDDEYDGEEDTGLWWKVTLAGICILIVIIGGIFVIRAISIAEKKEGERQYLIKKNGGKDFEHQQFKYGREFGQYEGRDFGRQEGIRFGKQEGLKQGMDTSKAFYQPGGKGAYEYYN